MTASQRRLGELLVSAGILDATALAKGIELQRESGAPLLDALIRNRLVDERAALRYVAESNGSRYITTDKLRQAKLEPDLLDRVPARHAEKLGVLPLSYVPSSGTLTLAVAELDPGLIEQVRLAAGVRSVVPIIASRPGLQAAIKRFYYGDIYAFAELDQPEVRAVVRPAPPGEVLAREDSPVGRAPAGEPKDSPQTRVFGAASESSRGSNSPMSQEESEAEGLRHENRLLKLASELQRHLSRERDSASILQRVLAFAFDTLPADDGVLLEVSSPEGELKPVGVRSRVADAGELVVSETLVRQVIEKRQGVLTGDAMTDSRFSGAESVVSAGLRSAMGVPLVVSGRVWGALVLDTRNRVDVFSDRHLQMLMAIAAQASASLESAELTRRIAEESRARAHLARFLPPQMVDLALSGQLPLSEDGERHEATVLVAGIREFSRLTELLPPDDLVALLNEHFEHLVDVVFAHGGLLDRFAGERLVALWGAPAGREDHAATALRAALEMGERVDRLNELRLREDRPAIEVGIGVASGPVLFGAMGSTRRLELTAVGGPVDAAVRLAERAGPMQVVASEATVEAASGQFDTEPFTGAAIDATSHTIRALSVTGERAQEQ